MRPLEDAEMVSVLDILVGSEIDCPERDDRIAVFKNCASHLHHLLHRSAGSDIRAMVDATDARLIGVRDWALILLVRGCLQTV